MEFALVLILGLIAGTLGGVIGFGTSIIVMPALVLVFGPQEAVPIMAVASVMANASRVAAWWREVDWRAVAAYGATGVPAAALGAATLLVLPIARRGGRARRLLHRHDSGPALDGTAAMAACALPHLALVGAGIGFLTGIVASTGPINAPFFLAYGLVKGAYLGTEAMGSLVVFVAKAITFRSLGALPLEILGKGLITGSSLMAGAFIAKRFVNQLDAERFRLLMDGLLLVAGLTMLWAAAGSAAPLLQ